MLRIDRIQKTLVRLAEKALPEVGLTERLDIQRMICSSPDAFFAEMGEQLLLIGEEVRPADVVEDRIDLLAIDREGAVVVMELKRGSHKLHLLQSLTYAAMVSDWDATQLVDERARLTNHDSERVEEEIEQFLTEDPAKLNETQRIMLLAEDFDYAVLATAEWLSEQHGIDIRCYRMALSTDDGAEYLTCTCIYPPPELAEHAKRRGRVRPVSSSRKWQSWDDLFEAVDNEAMAQFLREELAAGADGYLGRSGKLRYRINGRKRFDVNARSKAAYVWQLGRFDNDLQFWTDHLGESCEAQPVASGRRLRFYLKTKEQFATFRQLRDSNLQSMEFGEAEDFIDEGDQV